jgi:hypothetical protein
VCCILARACAFAPEDDGLPEVSVDLIRIFVACRRVNGRKG